MLFGHPMLLRLKILIWLLWLSLVSTHFLTKIFSSNYRYCDHSHLSFSQARVRSHQVIFHGYSCFPSFQFWYGANHDVWYARYNFQHYELLSFSNLHARSDKNPRCFDNKPTNERYELSQFLYLDPSSHLDPRWLHDGLPGARCSLQQYPNNVLPLG